MHPCYGYALACEFLWDTLNWVLDLVADVIYTVICGLAGLVRRAGR